MISRRFSRASVAFVILAGISLWVGNLLGQAPTQPKKTPEAAGGSKANAPKVPVKSENKGSPAKVTKTPAATTAKEKTGKPAPTTKAATKTQPLPRVYAPTRPRTEAAPKFPWKEKITTTIFWIGEAPTENNPTPNHKSSWDTNWQVNYGGYDDPNPASRNWEYCPKKFTPKLNPFYIALPFNDVAHRELAKKKIPWHAKKWNGEYGHSVCEHAWIAIRYGPKVCYAQWEDCGPFVTDDADYVFGKARPKNTENNSAGLDVSPAVRDYLGISSGAQCDWRFCTREEVPDGPWKRYGKNNPFVKDEAAEFKKLQDEYAELEKKRQEWLKNQDLSKSKPR